MNIVKLRAIGFVLRMIGSATVLMFKLTGVYLVEMWRKRAAVRRFRLELRERGVPVEAAQVLSKQYSSMLSLREMIKLARSVSK